MRLPSLTQALLEPAKLTSASLLVVFSRLANCAIGGAAYSPMPYMISASVRPGEPHRPGDAPHRHARGTRDHQFAARRQIAEAHQRADHGADRQQFERLLRQIEQREQKRIAGAVAADADVALLADEQEQTRPASTAPPSPCRCR